MIMPFLLFAVVGYWYGVREKLGVEFFTYSKKCSKLYDSYAVFDEKTRLMMQLPGDGGEGSVSDGGDPPSPVKKHKPGLLKRLFKARSKVKRVRTQ